MDRDRRARTGRLQLSHGEVRTPAFVPLATKARARTRAAEVAALGYDMVLGNTFHLFLAPGHELVARFGGLHGFMRWDGPIITDSGGFQVFSMGHGTVADEIKGRAAHGGERAGAILADRGGGRALPLLRRRLASASWGPRPRWRCRRRSAPTSRSCSTSARRSTSPRLHRPLDRAHASLAGPLPRLARRARPARARPSTAIVQGGVHEDLRRGSALAVAARRAPGIAIGGSLGATRRRCTRWSSWAIDELPEDRPRHLLGIGDVDDLMRGVELGIDTFDCAMPTRLGRHGMALVPDPAEALARRPRQGAAGSESRRADHGRLPVPGLRGGLLARLPALPVRSARADRAAARSRCTTSPSCARLMADLRDRDRRRARSREVRGGAAGRRGAR